MNTQTMVLQLIHGRPDPDAVIGGWGFDAPPIRGITFFRGTYLTTLTLGFGTQAALEAARLQTGWLECDDLTLEMQLSDGLIRCKDGYYGDFELYLSP
ncbi:MAG: hypothetical protein IT422_15805 [Pirellulaceae bacterium]|nr:hypothetical protein [Pirellulaceae bacterium]